MKQVFVILFSFFVFHDCIYAQDSLKPAADSGIHLPVKAKVFSINNILKENIFLSRLFRPVSAVQIQKRSVSKDLIFYVLAAMILLIAILKFVYHRYFSNLIRVFFNTSLRQSQLTDQLIQAALPSMFFNLFFMIIGGCYLYLLLNYFGRISFDDWHVLLICIAGLLIIYSAKFCTLKFVGWLTGYKEEANTYIFIVFLINKIISFCLVPVVIIISFSDAWLVNITVIISFIVIALMFIMRFFRSYGLFQSRLKISTAHFFLYITGIELLPLLLIYKAAVFIMTKNL